MDIKTVLETAVTVILTSGVLGLVFRSVLQHFLTLDLEKHRSKIQSDYNRELEAFKDRLQQAALEHEVRFTKLHEQQAEVISQLYSKLAQAERCYSSLINPLQITGEPALEEKWKSAQDAGNAFVTYFDEHRIYFEKDLCDLINNFNRQLYDSFLKFAISRRPEVNDVTMWSAAWKGLSEGLPPIRERLETSFRAILGVTEASKN